MISVGFVINSHVRFVEQAARLGSALSGTSPFSPSWATFTTLHDVRNERKEDSDPQMSHAAPPSKRSTTSGKAEDDDAKPYVIVSEIGKGSFATVYKGYHEVSQY